MGYVPPQNNTIARQREVGGLWQILIDDVRRSPVDPNIGDQLIQLVKNVPAFPVTLPEQLSILGSHFLMAECESEWLTTIDTERDRPVKKMRHYHTLGLPHPVIYQLPEPDGIALKALQSGDNQPSILQMIFAWSYIFCGRWVEALKSTGADAQLLQHEEINTQNFWDFIRKQQWQAIVTYEDAVYFAPWSLAESGHGICNQRSSTTPVISFALKILTDICTTDKLYEQCIIALVVVMMLPDRAYRNEVLRLHCSPLRDPRNSDSATYEPCFNQLLLHLDSCITLSCNQEGIHSLLCSVFFDPKVSCNLIGAQMTGIIEAISPFYTDDRILLNLMTSRCPKLAPLWAAAVCTGQVKNILEKSAGGTPPLNLPVASWTGIKESFIQARYTSDLLPAGQVLRAEEWRHLYLTTDERLPPHAASPPFGTTKEGNLNMDVRRHLGHNHRFMSYRMFWILKTGKKFPSNIPQTTPPAIDVVIDAAVPRSHGGIKSLIDNLEGGSCNATVNIFVWIQNIEGGLWLRSGSESSNDVRRLMRHNWIAYDEGDEEDQEDDEELKSNNSDTTPNLNRIQEWFAESEKSPPEPPDVES